MPTRHRIRSFVLALASAAAAAVVGAQSVRVWNRWGAREYPPLGRTVRLPSGPMHVIEKHTPERPFQVPLSRRKEQTQPPTLVFIHGSDGVAQDWPESPLWTRLPSGVRALAPDRLGHGHTPLGHGDVTVEANTRHLLELLEAEGINNAVLVGHSYGGTVALAMAAKAPQRVGALVLISPLAYPQPEQTRMLARLLGVRVVFWLITRIFFVPIGLFTVELEGGRAFFPAPMPHPWRRMMWAFSLRAGQLAALAEENRSLVRELAALSRLYTRLSTPTFILVGERDALAPAHIHGAPLAQALAQADLRVYGGGHELHWTHAGEVAHAVADAVAGAERGAR